MKLSLFCVKGTIHSFELEYSVQKCLQLKMILYRYLFLAIFRIKLTMIT